MKVEIECKCGNIKKIAGSLDMNNGQPAIYGTWRCNKCAVQIDGWEIKDDPTKCDAVFYKGEWV